MPAKRRRAQDLAVALAAEQATHQQLADRGDQRRIGHRPDRTRAPPGARLVALATTIQRRPRRLPEPGHPQHAVASVGGGRDRAAHRLDLRRAKGRPASRCSIFVGFEVEQLRPLPVVVDQLVAAAAHHPLLDRLRPGPGRHAVGAEFGERLIAPGRRRILRDRQEAPPLGMRQGRSAERRQHGRAEVDQVDDLRAPLAAGKTPGRRGSAAPDRFVVEGLLPPQAALADLIAMVGGVDDQRVVARPSASSRRGSARSSVERAHEAIIRGPRAHHPLVRHVQRAGMVAPAAQIGCSSFGTGSAGRPTLPR